MSAMRIIVFGATGEVGRRLVDEALRRGHDLSAVVHSASKLDRLPAAATGVVLDAKDTEASAAAIARHDLVISALRPPEGREDELPTLTQSVLEAAGASDKRVLVVGGAANLFLPDRSGHTVLTAPGYLPDSVRPIAAACFAQFMVCVADRRARWQYFSPPASLSPGHRTGRYRRGVDVLLVDDAGESKISMEDFAVAVLDAAEATSPEPRRVTVAY